MCLHFAAYSGIRLPLRLVDPIADADLAHRSSFVRGYFDSAGRLVACEKVVSGQVELSHRYEYDEEGGLRRATIAAGDEEPKTLEFDASNRPVQTVARA